MTGALVALFYGLIAMLGAMSASVMFKTMGQVT